MTSKILIVDDDVWITKVFTKILFNLGYNDITIVNNGFDAVAKALEIHPNLIFLDLLMPEIDGLTTLKMFRKISATSKIKIIICTANGDMDNLTKAMSSGASDFISKPFTADTIKEKITKTLREIQAEAEANASLEPRTQNPEESEEPENKEFEPELEPEPEK